MGKAPVMAFICLALLVSDGSGLSCGRLFRKCFSHTGSEPRTQLGTGAQWKAKVPLGLSLPAKPACLLLRPHLESRLLPTPPCSPGAATLPSGCSSSSPSLGPFRGLCVCCSFPLVLCNTGCFSSSSSEAPPSLLREVPTATLGRPDYSEFT